MDVVGIHVSVFLPCQFAQKRKLVLTHMDNKVVEQSLPPRRTSFFPIEKIWWKAECLSSSPIKGVQKEPLSRTVSNLHNISGNSQDEPRTLVISRMPRAREKKIG